MEFTTLKNICPSSGRNSYYLFLGIVLLFSCNKETDIPYANIPQISLLKISHDTIREYQDVLILTIQYRDGDGNLGFEEPNKYALFVRDTRLEKFDGFYIGPLAPPDAVVPIQGELNIEFPSLFLFGNGRSEATFFEIKMLDRAGNESNILTTDPVIISKP